MSSEVEEKPNTVLDSEQLKKDTMAETAFETVKKDNLSVLVTNIKVYCSLLIENKLDEFEVSKYKYLLLNQMSDVWFEEPLKDFYTLIEEPKTHIEGYKLYKNLDNFEEISRELIKMKSQAENEESYNRTQNIISGFFKQIENILDVSEKTIRRLNRYDVYGNNMDESVESDDGDKSFAPNRYEKEIIDAKIDLAPSVFSWVKPPLHQVYVSEAAKVYNQIVPFRIKTVIPNSLDSPVINVRNYFSETIDESKAIMAYCIPGRKAIGYYAMSDICKLHTMERDYYQERELNNEWVFSVQARSVTTSEGKIFSINSRTTPEKIDPCMYEITEVKASNRGPLPLPKRECGFVYMNKNLYVICGKDQHGKVSRKNHRYSIKDKKWYPIADSNVATRKPTVCTLRNRYLLKIGGLNEFDYINKVIEIYDSLTDKWALVRATPKSITEEVEILEDSSAVQINEDEVFIFGGKNANKFSSDTGFILQINQIRERTKGAPKVNGELWNASVGKRNILTFLGECSSSNAIVHFNCIYNLRIRHSQALSI